MHDLGDDYTTTVVRTGKLNPAVMVTHIASGITGRDAGSTAESVNQAQAVLQIAKEMWRRCLETTADLQIARDLCMRQEKLLGSMIQGPEMMAAKQKATLTPFIQGMETATIDTSTQEKRKELVVLDGGLNDCKDHATALQEIKQNNNSEDTKS